jgi:hypothetical protein
VEKSPGASQSAIKGLGSGLSSPGHLLLEHPFYYEDTIAEEKGDYNPSKAAKMVKNLPQAANIGIRRLGIRY